MEDTTQQVTADAPSATADTSAAVGTDLGATTGATASTEATAADAGLIGNDAVTEAPEADPYALSGDEQQAQTIGRERFDSLHQGYKSLEADHRALRAEYEQITTQAQAFDPFGGVEGAAQLMSSLFQQAQSNDGPMVDQNGSPIYDTSAFVDQLDTLDPNVSWALMYDLMQRNPESAQDLAKHWGWINESDAAAPQSQPVESDKAALQDIQTVFPQQSREFQAAFNKLPQAVKRTVTDLLSQNDPEADAQVSELLQEKATQLAYEQRQADAARANEQRIANAAKEFQNGIAAHVKQSLEQANIQAFSDISKQLSQQIKFSSDPAVNRSQQAAVKTFLSTLANPSTRFMVADDLAEMGISVPDSDWQRLSSYTEAMADVAGFEKLQEGIKAGGELVPHLQKMLQQAGGLKAYNEAKAVAKREGAFVLAKMNAIALTYAKALTTGLNQNGAVEDAIGAANGSRPNVQGHHGNNNSQFVPPKGVDPFSVEFLQARRAAQGA